MLDEAASHWAAVLATDPDHRIRTPGWRRCWRGTATAGAIDCLRRVVEALGGQDLDAMTSLGIALSATASTTRRSQLLSQVARRRPELGSGPGRPGDALLAADRIEEAITGFSEALRVDRGSAQAYCGLGLAYQRLQRWYEAAERSGPPSGWRPTGGWALQPGAGAGGAGGPRRRAARCCARPPLAPDDAEIREALQSLLAPPAEPGATPPGHRPCASAAT